MEDETLSSNQRRQMRGTGGWSHQGFLGKLAELYGFDLLKDVVPDLMHLTMVLIKDLAHASCDVLDGWANQDEANPCHVNNWGTGMYVDHLFFRFRSNMNAAFSRGRRFPRDLTHAAISSWSAEECLIFLRLEWRWLLQQFRDMWDAAGVDVPDVFEVLQTAWVYLEELLLPLLDRRGCQIPPEAVKLNAFQYMLHLATIKTDGRQAFCLALQTYTLHSSMHLWKFMGWWGNLFELWCFKFERMASELTQLLTGWNGRGEPGSYIARRMALQHASTVHMQGIIDRCGHVRMYIRTKLIIMIRFICIPSFCIP